MTAAASYSSEAEVFEQIYCGHCGELLADGDHTACARHLELEPPRYCQYCRRRMVVQVSPAGWTARCSRHGTITSAQ